MFVVKSNTEAPHISPLSLKKETGIPYAHARSMIFDTLGSGPDGERHLKGNDSTTTDERHRSPYTTGRPEVPLSHRPACAISGPALLQTEQVLLRRAPELVLIVRQIRSGGAMVVQSGNSGLEGTFNLYRVSISPEHCKMIADALAHALDVQHGHPASLRVLVNIWRKLEEEGC